MNPAILGALIGAIPGTIAAGLATWSSVRSARTALTSDHDRWLREKRSDTYLDMLHLISDAQTRRWSVLEPQEVTEEMKRQINDGYEIYNTDRVSSLIARGWAYASWDAGKAFDEAWEADKKVWLLALDNTQGMNLEIDDKLKQAREDADKAGFEFVDKARDDLQQLANNWMAIK